MEQDEDEVKEEVSPFRPLPLTPSPSLSLTHSLIRLHRLALALTRFSPLSLFPLAVRVCVCPWLFRC